MVMYNIVYPRIVAFNQVFCHCPDIAMGLPLRQPGNSGKWRALADPYKKPESEGFILSPSDENGFS